MALLKSESNLFQEVKAKTSGMVYWERVEPRTEGGFPDTYFVMKNPKLRMEPAQEGTMEFKVHSTSKPNWKVLLRGSQKAGFIDYFLNGGTKRFFISGKIGTPIVHLINSHTLYSILDPKFKTSSHLEAELNLDEDFQNQFFRCIRSTL